MIKKKIFTGTFYKLQLGEILGNFDHYNFKIPLTEYFDILQYCYNNDENKIDILTRTYDNKSIKIIRFNKMVMMSII
jgi:hypothetical protein